MSITSNPIFPSKSQNQSNSEEAVAHHDVEINVAWDDIAREIAEEETDAHNTQNYEQDSVSYPVLNEAEFADLVEEADLSEVSNLDDNDDALLPVDETDLSLAEQYADSTLLTEYINEDENLIDTDDTSELLLTDDIEIQNKVSDIGDDFDDLVFDTLNSDSSVEKENLNVLNETLADFEKINIEPKDKTILSDNDIASFDTSLSDLSDDIFNDIDLDDVSISETEEILAESIDDLEADFDLSLDESLSDVLFEDVDLTDSTNLLLEAINDEVDIQATSHIDNTFSHAKNELEHLECFDDEDLPEVTDDVAQNNNDLKEDIGLLDLNEDSALEEFEDIIESINTDEVEADDIDNSIDAATILEKLSDVLAQSFENFNIHYTHIIQLEQDSEGLLEALSEYSECLQIFWDSVEKNKLSGLSLVCQFINENLMMIGSVPVLERQPYKVSLEMWPALVLDYLLAPTESAEALVQFLNDKTAWPQSLDTTLNLADDNLLFELSQINTSNSDLTSSCSIENLDESVDELSHIVEPLLEDIIEDSIVSSVDLTPIADLLGVIIEPLNEHLEIILQAEDESEQLLEASGEYMEALQTLSDVCVEQSGLLTLLECLNNNILSFAMLPLAERQEKEALLSNWIMLFLDYALSPEEEAASLVSYFQDDNWLEPLDDEQAVECLQALLTPSNVEIENVIEQDVYTDFSELETLDNIDEEELESKPDLSAITSALTDIIEPLNNELKALLNAEDESEELLEAAGSYAETLQVFADATAFHSGMENIFDFLNENILELGMLPKAERQACLAAFESWPALLLDYSLVPTESTDALLAHLQRADNEIKWPAPLDIDQAEIYKAALLNFSGMTQVEAEQNETSASLTDDEFESFIDPITSQSTGTQINLGTPEQLEHIMSALQKAAESLSTALEAFVSMDNTDDILLEAVETYTSHVQNIWDSAEQAGLTGLQEVCTFVNDNLLALAAEDKARREAVHEQLELWPIMVLDYLSSPNDSIEPLIELLQNENWLILLDIEQVQHLQTQLAEGSNKEEVIFEEITAEEPLEDIGLDSGESDISLGNAEMLEMLSGEIIDAQEELDAAVAQFCELSSDDGDFEGVADNYVDHIGRLIMAAEMIGLAGLQSVCEFISENAKTLATKDQSYRVAAKNILLQWPALILKYLESPKDNVIVLLNHLREKAWPNPLADEQAHKLLNELTQASTADFADEEESRTTVATAEDVAIDVPEDVNQDLLDAFLQEAPQNASEFSSSLQKIIKAPDAEEIKLAQRIAHTLKGSANIIGVKGIASFAHHLEDIMEYLAENEVPPPKALTDTMMEAADTLEIMVDVLLGKESPPENAVTVLQEVLDWANRIDNGQLEVSETELAERKAELEKVAAAAPVVAPKEQAASTGEAEQTLRVATKTIDELLRLVGEMSIAIGQIQERLGTALSSTKSLNKQETLIQQKTYELETLVDVQDVSNRSRHRKMGDNSTEVEVKDNHSDFDSLEFEQYNELHSVSHSFIESVADSREMSGCILESLEDLEGMFIQQERLNKEFQQIVMTTRMVPIKSIVARLERIVRQTCRTTNKLADFVMEGGENLMDGDVLAKLTDPLMHILRNAVDHGMETPEERLAANKPETGLVLINCFRQGNSVVMQIKDNGKGLNYERIRSIAVERELIQENQELTNKEMARLIFIPGFSTKDAVTQVSGRGVGMDVVHTSIQDLKGSVDIDSIPGEGTTISLTLPLSLVTMHVLLVVVGEEQFAIPTSQLSQVLTADSGEFRKVGNDISFHMAKNAYPIVVLGEMLHFNGVLPVQVDEKRPLVFVEEEGHTTAVLIDNFLDSRDLVSKSMGNYVKDVKGVSGSSILGNGNVIAMLDLPELLRRPKRSLSVSSGASQAGTVVASIPLVMVVDDSLSVRKVLSQMVEDQGYAVLQAKDGLEAVEIVGQTKPDVMLVDMEMPRMNGIELTAHIRANADTKDIPIFMITSRSTEKHRTLAKDAGVTEYLTKPYQEEELLGLIQNVLTA